MKVNLKMIKNADLDNINGKTAINLEETFKMI
jgi:hypothetical protein